MSPTSRSLCSCAATPAATPPAGSFGWVRISHCAGIGQSLTLTFGNARTAAAGRFTATFILGWGRCRWIWMALLRLAFGAGAWEGSRGSIGCWVISPLGGGILVGFINGLCALLPGLLLVYGFLDKSWLFPRFWKARILHVLRPQNRQHS